MFSIHLGFLFSYRLPDGFTMLLSLTHVYLNDTFLDFLPANIGRYVLFDFIVITILGWSVELQEVFQWTGEQPVVPPKLPISMITEMFEVFYKTDRLCVINKGLQIVFFDIFFEIWQFLANFPFLYF